MICTQYTSAYEEARAARRADPQRARPAVRVPLHGRRRSSSSARSTSPTPTPFDYFGDLLDEAVGHGYDGWMEDFGEYTPLDAHGYDGSTGEAYHNKYVVGYHAAARAYARDRAPRPLARFNRSGWTGTARHSQIVWGGDPTTGWGFDGLESAITNGLTMGLSGVSLWGSDIGGFFALSEPQTTPELLARWIEFGFASGVMRTQANGFELPARRRARRSSTARSLPIWARYAKLRTQLYPYLSAAAGRSTTRSGMPLMRHLALAYPDDPTGDRARRTSTCSARPARRAGHRSRASASARSTCRPGAGSTGGARSPSTRAARRTSAAPRVLDGARDVTLPAPLGGAAAARARGCGDPAARTRPSRRWPTTAPAPRCGCATVNARLRLLVWPRGRRTASLGSGGGGDRDVRGDLLAAGSCEIQGNRTRMYEIEAALGSLGGGAFRPCRVLRRRPRADAGQRWRYDRATGVLQLRVFARDALVVVRVLPRLTPRVRNRGVGDTNPTWREIPR